MEKKQSRWWGGAGGNGGRAGERESQRQRTHEV